MVSASSAAQTARPPVRPLGLAVATSQAMTAVSAVRALPGGRLLVNDVGGRRVLLLDSMMKTVGVVADSTKASRYPYGRSPAGLLPYRADSSLLIEPATYSMLVISPQGSVVRVAASPRTQDIQFMLGWPNGNAGFDARGRMIYRTVPSPIRRLSTSGRGDEGSAHGGGTLVRLDMLTRRLDTAARVRVSVPRIHSIRGNRGATVFVPVIDPFPESDEWTVLTDGTIAILRSDYHVDYVDADGRVTSGPRIPFDWQRLSDSAKVAVLDSATREYERMRAAQGRPTSREGLPAPVAVDASELPDYRPAFSTGTIRADAENRLWIRTNSPMARGNRPVYDVIDRNGRLTDRVAIPSGTTIIGFGAAGVVYLGVRDAAGVHIARTRER